MSKKFHPSDLALAPLHELTAQQDSLTSYIERERRKGRDHLDLEVEACYLYREIDYRHQVSRAHESWLATNPIQSADDSYQEGQYEEFVD